MNTEPCELCCDMLEKVRDAAKQNLSGKNLEVFLTEIGVGFNTFVFRGSWYRCAMLITYAYLASS